MKIDNVPMRELECEDVFRQIRSVFSANTPENHPLVFVSESDFKAGMSILAISARMFPELKIYAFQLMNNHIHLVIGGVERKIMEFFDYFADRLEKYFGGNADLSAFRLKLFPINDLAYLRNVIAYVNRNGFVVNQQVTPFSYPWGSSAYYFQPLAARYAELAGKPIGVLALRALMHSRYCDYLRSLTVVDGYVTPLEFCDLATAEKIFRNAGHYFFLISRKVEMYAEVAKSIGESVYFCDNDLFLATVKLARERYGTEDLRTLSATSKIELAKVLHYDYNAGEKQIQRILKIEAVTLNALF